MKPTLSNSPNFGALGDQLIDQEKEQEYRKYHLNTDINQATVFMVLATVPLLLAMFNRVLDFVRESPEKEFLLRNLFINLLTAVTIYTFIFIIRRFRSVKSLEITLFIYMMIFGTLLVVNQLFRPPDFVGTIYILFILHNTFLMPVPLRVQIVPTLLFCTAMITIIIRFREPTYPSESVNTIIAIGTCLLMGLIASRLLGRYRRRSYVFFTRERETRTQLEETLATIKSLSGLVPICANCHKIRDEENDWHRIESYIQQHSEAEFTHGICPDCAETLYGKKG
jgi:hypothetical protein